MNLACKSDPWDLATEILSRIKEPVIPTETICNIREYGAIRSTNDDSVEELSETVDANIKAFQDAIDDCYDQGGGIVRVPTGTYMTSAIRLRTNISLEIQSDAVIRFTRNTTKYPIVFTRWEGVELWNYSPFIYAYGEENIAITGKKCV